MRTTHPQRREFSSRRRELYSRSLRGEPRALLVSQAVALAIICGALVGCGTSSKAATSSQSTTTAQTGTSAATPEKVPVIDLAVKIPGTTAFGTLPRRYTCDGANASLPIQWGSAPAGTREIDILISTLEHGREYVQWAVAGISPSLRGLQAGRPPAGAIIGRNRYGQTGYSICPAHRTTHSYFVLYFPLPRHVPVRPGFDPLALGQELIHVAPHEGQYMLKYHRA